MGIVDVGGRYRSIRSDEDVMAIIESEMASMSEEEKEIFKHILNDYKLSGRSPFVEVASNHIYRKPPVSVQTWLDDPYYLGEAGKSIFPELKKDLTECFEGRYEEALIGGSLGSGKTSWGVYAYIRMLYEISCLRNPQEVYGIQTYDNIAFPVVAVTEAVADAIIHDRIARIVEGSKYFQDNFKPLSVSKASGIVFPNKIVIPPGASTETGNIGSNAFGALIDETNFFRKSKNQDGNPTDKAYEIYTSIKRRIQSRFESNGKLPGIVVLISSKKHVNSFTEKMIRDNMNNSKMFVREHATYEVVPQERFSGKKFRVAVGTETDMSRILEDGEPDPDGMRVVEVPIEYKESYEKDIDGSLRDISGVATVNLTPFITRRNKIVEAIDPNRTHPYSEYIWEQDIPAKFKWEHLVTTMPDGRKIPKINPSAVRHIHLDLSKNNDKTGIAMSHISGYEEVTRGETTETVPKYVVDFVLAVKAPHGGEISQFKIRQLIYELSKAGFYIKSVSTDQYQSLGMQQALKEQGYSVETISVDKIGPYDILKSALYEDRVSYYRYELLLKELRELQKDWKTLKVDHPPESENGCFVGETMIPLLNGETVPISSLDGKTAWVHSCTADGFVRAGKAVGRLTKHVSTLIEIVLDNGKSIRCTEDHRFMLRTGEYKEAKDLNIGIDRIMSFSRKKHKGYYSVKNRDQSVSQVHRMVAKQLLGDIDGLCVHHVNENSEDNSPDNLQIMTHFEHRRHHASQRHLSDSNWRKKLYAGAAAFNNSEKGRASHANALRRTVQMGLLKNPNWRKDIARKNRNFRKDIDINKLLEVKNVAKTANEAGKLLGCGRNVVIRVLMECGYSSWDDYLSPNGLNHRIVSKKYVSLDTPVPVYDLEVDEFSNFALDVGVFVHNSKDVADAVCGAIFALSQRPVSISFASNYTPSRQAGIEDDDAWVIDHGSIHVDKPSEKSHDDLVSETQRRQHPVQEVKKAASFQMPFEVG
jgi:hypothetical protein